MKFGARVLWVTLVLLLSSTGKYVNIGNQIQRRLANKLQPYNEKKHRCGIATTFFCTIREVENE